jgi:hypothetical protein
MFIGYPTIYGMSMLQLVLYMNILIELKYTVYPNTLTYHYSINISYPDQVCTQVHEWYD